MFYATQENDYKIAQNAEIKTFETEQAAREYLLSAFNEKDWDYSTAVIEAGSFGDAWIKCYGDLDDNETFEPFSRDQLTIRRPGQHPGVGGIWIEPRVPVLVVSYIEERD